MESKTVYLVDLDGTLLKAHRLFFAANIFYILKNFFPELGLKTFKVVNASMKALLSNSNRELTNFDCMLQDLSQRSGKDLNKVLWNFYRQDFPKLASLCSPIPYAAEALHQLKSQGHRLYLTTNPIWPEECVHLRLQWAGLEARLFDGITHSQNWHSCKPQVRYYEEILERWALDPQSCILIGDSPLKEGPAAQLGIQVVILPKESPQAYWKNLRGL